MLLAGAVPRVAEGGEVLARIRLPVAMGRHSEAQTGDCSHKPHRTGCPNCVVSSRLPATCSVDM